MKKIKYIKANDKYYYLERFYTDYSFTVFTGCSITKGKKGTFIVEYYDKNHEFSTKGYVTSGKNNVNKKIVLYPKGIQEIVYI